MRIPLLPHDRKAEAERAERLIKTLTSERDAAYSTGYSSGYLDGYEAGLRALLEDAETALGRAA